MTDQMGARHLGDRHRPLTIEDEKFGFHQSGTSKMPARPLVLGDPLPTLAQFELEEVAERYVAQWARGFDA